MVKAIGVGGPPRDRARARRPRPPRAVGAGPPALARRRAPARPPRDRVAAARTDPESTAPGPRIRQAWTILRSHSTSAGSSRASSRTGARGEVLTLAYMNAESLRLTRETGETHFFSRSRQELWHKGATSGNTQRVRSIRYDCDGDALLALVEPAGPACHTGERTCFHRGELEPAAPLRGAARARAHDRRSGPRATPRGLLHRDVCSPTRQLAGAKVQEEAEEVARAVARGVRRARRRGGRRRRSTTWRCCCEDEG